MSLDSILRSTGKNLFDINATPTFQRSGATYSISGTTVTMKSNNTTNNGFYYSVPVEIGKTYTVSVNSIDWDSTSFGIFLSDEKRPDKSNYGQINKTTLAKTFTVIADTLWIHGYLSYDAGDFTFTFDKLQVEYGSTATSYEAYHLGPETVIIPSNTGDKEVWKVSYGSRNLIPYPYYNTTKTENNVTFTVNSDNSVTVNGTAAADTLFFLCGIANYTMYKGTYTLSGCPSGGSNTTYCQVLGSSDFMDTGNGVTRTYPQDIKQNVFIKIYSGYTANNLVFKPQLELGNKATSYIPYSREQIWKSTNNNLLGVPTAGTQTITGVTFTNNNDGTITVNTEDKATANSTYNLGYSMPVETNRKYILSGCPSGGSSSTFGMYYYDTVTSNYDYGDGVTFTPKGTTLSIYIRVFSGQAVDNLVFKPKLEYA